MLKDCSTERALVDACQAGIIGISGVTAPASIRRDGLTTRTGYNATWNSCWRMLSAAAPGRLRRLLMPLEEAIFTLIVEKS